MTDRRRQCDPSLKQNTRVRQQYDVLQCVCGPVPNKNRDNA